MIPKENLDNFKDELSPIMENYYKKVAKTYCDVYTHDDIKSLLKFYKTDLGQSLLKGQSEIMKKTMAMAQSLSNQIMPVVQKYSK